MIFKESPISLLFIAAVLVLKACTEPGVVTSTEEQSSIPEPESTEVITQAESVSYKLSDRSILTINPSLYGFNTAALFFHYKGEKQGEDKIKALQPNILRFPGGTTANFYHFNAPAYGYKAEDAAMVAGSNAYENAQNSARKDAEDIGSYGLKDNYAVNMVTLAKATGASVLLVTNQLSGTLEENLAMVDFFKASGVKIAGIELGNEYYLKAYQEEFPDVESYIQSAKPLAKKIRAKYPEIPLAVVASPIAEMKDVKEKKASQFDDWNSKLAKEDFYDGYIVHMYAKDKACEQKGISIQTFECYVGSNLDYVRYTVPAGIKTYAETFQGKKMWITEWNVKEVFDGLGNSMLQTLYFAENMLMLSEQSNVGIATYHNLLTGGEGFNIISSNKGGAYSENAAYNSAELLKKIFRPGVSSMELTETGESQNSYVTVKAFQDSEGILIYLVNHGPAPVKLNLETYANLPSSDIKMNSVYAANLTDSGNQIRKEEKKLNGLQDVLCQGRSVNLIRIAKK
nr:hypothetical protein [uncultured bacterium]